MQTYKVSRAYQNNGPDYFIVSSGKWKAPVFATCETEEAAKLTAASTEMLEALQELIAWEAFMGGFESPAWDKARAAIAKATSL